MNQKNALKFDKPDKIPQDITTSTNRKCRTDNKE